MEAQANYLNMLHDDNKYKEMRDYALAHHVPIMDVLSMRFINQLITIHKPQRILEIGTAIGYSAINMAHASNTEIITIERNQDMIEQAKINIANYQLENKIQILEGDATALMSQEKIKGEFDFILIDAAKGKYKTFFKYASNLLTESGLILSDNVLFRGFVADNHKAPSKRLANLAKKIDDYNKWLMAQDNYQTTIVPIGDGIAITNRTIIDG